MSWFVDGSGNILGEDHILGPGNNGVLKGGTKNDTSKNRLDLLPLRSLWEVGGVYTLGATKYSDRNWEKGIRFSRVLGALLRHLFAWWLREDHDPEDGQHHLDSVIWCAMTLRHYAYYKKYNAFDDRVDYGDMNA